MKNLLKNNLVSPLTIFLILLSIAVSSANLLNQSFYFKKESVDLPNSTKKLIVDTIKREIDVASKGKKEAKNLENVVDEISYASQLGRLDAISLLLALFGIVIGFGAIFGFLHIRENSRLIAEQTTTDYLKVNGPKIIKDYLDKHLMAKIGEVNAKSEIASAPNDQLVNEMIQHLDDDNDNKK